MSAVYHKYIRSTALNTMPKTCCLFQDHPEEVVPLLQKIAVHLPDEFEPYVPLVVVPLLLESLKHPL